MTFMELSLELAFRCYDSVAVGNADGKRFTASQRLSALNAGTLMTVNALLSGSTDSRKVHDLVQELIVLDTVTVNSNGFPLTSLTQRVSSAGVKFVEALIGAHWVPAVERTVNELQFRGNRYLSGTDDYPVYHIIDNRLFLEITVGSYPLNARIYYVRLPRSGVYTNPDNYQSTSFELSENLSEAVLSAACTILFSSTDELDRVRLFFEMFTSQVGTKITESLSDVDNLGGVRK